jgi:lysophospholipid acyltransferase (LPLAT)-like uncharacterized protein/uncharacterized protein with HEPN domain
MVKKLHLREQPKKAIHIRWSWSRKLRYKILRGVFPLIVYPIVMVLSVVYRWRHRVSIEFLEIMASKEPFVAAFWHSDMLLLQSLGKRVGWSHRAAVMVALSQVGEIETRLLKLLNYYVIRGSERKRGKEALEDMKDILSQGAIAGMAVDGPSGPAKEVKAGVVYLARHCQVPIVPLAFIKRREWALPTWDATRIPVPFSGCIVVNAKPIFVPKDIDNKEFERIVKRVGTVLKKLEKSSIRWEDAKKVNIKLLNLHTITDCIDHIERYTKKLSPDDFLKNTLVQDAVVKRLETIEEALEKLKPFLRRYFRDTLWESLDELGVILADDYSETKVKRVWSVVKRDIPRLRKKIKYVIGELYNYRTEV